MKHAETASGMTGTATALSVRDETLSTFKAYFSDLASAEIEILDELYAENVCFTDPLHEIHGRDALKAYFAKLNANLKAGGFVFTDESVVGDKAYLTWEMNIRLRRPKKSVSASGISVIVLGDKILSHRDYFDAGELFYEHIPILGALIRYLKRKLGGA